MLLVVLVRVAGRMINEVEEKIQAVEPVTTLAYSCVNGRLAILLLSDERTPDQEKCSAKLILLSLRRVLGNKLAHVLEVIEDGRLLKLSDSILLNYFLECSALVEAEASRASGLNSFV